MSTRVVITGMGAITPLGNTVCSFWEGLINGRSGVDRIPAFDPREMDSQIAGEVKNFDPIRSGVIIGSSIGGLNTISQQFRVLYEKGPSRLSPFLVPMLLNNMAAGLVAIELGFQGPSYSVGSACATANQSIGEAWRLIRTG